MVCVYYSFSHKSDLTTPLINVQAGKAQDREGRLAQLERQREEVEKALAEALAMSSITLLQRQLQAFLQVGSRCGSSQGTLWRYGRRHSWRRL